MATTDRTSEEFRRELAALLNRYSRENGSDTPGFLLAEFLWSCLDAFDSSVRNREAWYGRRQTGPNVRANDSDRCRPTHPSRGRP